MSIAPTGDSTPCARRPGGVASGYSEVGAGGTHQARLEREAAEELTRRRLSALDLGSAPLCFGRLDLEPGAASGSAIFYVGRLAVTDEDQAPLIVDWRAPVAEPFYRATAIEPMGVVRRRHFLTRPGDGRQIVGLDDEVFDRAAASSSGFTVVGEGALLAALDRTRTGRMGDIVATIQAEQDEAIRAPLNGVLVVAGGPGTGKTAVALHRAAYSSIRTADTSPPEVCLLIGPTRCSCATSTRCCRPWVKATRSSRRLPRSSRPTAVVVGESREAARIKGDARMAQVIRRHCATANTPLPRAPRREWSTATCCA